MGESVYLLAVFIDENAEFFFFLWIKTRTSSRKSAWPNHRSLLHIFDIREHSRATTEVFVKEV